jgi:signal transduction histidine kinase
VAGAQTGSKVRQPPKFGIPATRRILRRLSLRYRIAGAVLLGLLVLFSFFGWLALRAINESKDVALAERLRLAEVTAQSVDSLIRHTGAQLESIAYLLGHDPEDRGEMEIMYSIMGTFNKIVSLNPAGQVEWVVPDEPPPATWRFAGDPQLQSALHPGATSTVQLQPADETNPPIAVVVTPVHDANGALQGYLAGELQLSHAGLQLVPLLEWEQSGHAEIVDGRGYVLAQSGGGDISDPRAHSSILQDFVAKHEAGTAIHHPPGGPDHVVAFYPLQSVPGGVVVEQREDKALAVSRSVERMILMYGLPALILAVAAAWYHAHTVMRPIRSLAGDAARMAGGDLETPIAAGREDEIGELARSFDEMRVRLRTAMDESAGWARELESRVRDRTREVEERNRALAELSSVRSQLLAKLISAQEEERKRVARELHDDTAQTLTALRMTLQTAEDALTAAPDRAQTTLHKARSQVDLALGEIRKAILDLRPSALDDLGLGAAVRWHAEHHLRAAGVKVRLEISGDDARVSGALATALFRIAQEAIANIVNHAKAKNAKLALRFGGGAVQLIVEDDGVGFDPQAIEHPQDSGRGLGIMGMRERAALFGGTVRIESKPGKGAKVRVSIPLT